MLLYINGLLQLESPLTFFLGNLRKLNQKGHIIIEYHFRVDIFFFVTIEKQLQELNSKFNDQVIDLLTLSIALIPKDVYKIFDIVRCVFGNARKQFFFNTSCFEIISHVLGKKIT